jgi:dTDP-4-amino-4,6-dideoxygalactose transaminase
VAGEGGLVATNRDDLAAAVVAGRNYGLVGDYNTRFIGLNARMSELHAAVAYESLVDLDENLEERRAVAHRYRSGLQDLPGLTCQHVDPSDESTYKDFTIAVDPEQFGVGRDAVVVALRREGIHTRSYFSPPVHRQLAYAWLEPATLPVTDQVAASVISLPIYGGMSASVPDQVLETLASIAAKADAVQAGPIDP